jgi:hypothetical protein
MSELPHIDIALGEVARLLCESDEGCWPILERAQRDRYEQLALAAADYYADEHRRRYDDGYTAAEDDARAARKARRSTV